MFLSSSAFGVNCLEYYKTQKDYINVKKDFKAIGDGVSSDSKALADAFKEANLKHKSVFIPAGTYLFGDPNSSNSSQLIIDSISVFGQGDQTILQKAYPKSTCQGSSNIASCSSVTLLNNKPSLKCLTVSSYTDNLTRSTKLLSVGVLAYKAYAFSIDSIKVLGAQAAGIASVGSYGDQQLKAHILDNKVEGTLADGIHMTGGSKFIEVIGNTITNVHDDGIAVVSYASKDHKIAIQKKIESISSNILIKNNIVTNVKARGITVVGGDYVYILNNKISNINNAGVYLFAEKSYNTYPPSNVVVSENKLYNNSLNYAKTGHPDIFVGSSFEDNPSFYTKNIKIYSNVINSSIPRNLLVSNSYNIDIQGNSFFTDQTSYNYIKNISNFNFINNKIINTKTENLSKKIYFNYCNLKDIVNMKRNLYNQIFFPEVISKNKVLEGCNIITF